MSRFFALLISLVSLAILTALIGGFAFIHTINKKSNVAEPTALIIASGTSGRGIASELADKNLITHPDLFYILLRLKNATVKAGEYEIPAHSSIADIHDILASGKTIQRNVTIAEGLTVKQAMEIINATEFLSGTITTPPAEGSLQPETYSYTRDETRDDLIKRMQAAHETLLNEVWEKRDPNITLTKEQAVILASIVEKETGKPEERAKIAGLFYNRLKIGMPLQTDPTIVYAITDGYGHMQGKRLYTKHLAVDSPYNTYKNVGLPPGPIANVGRAALEAVLHPEQHGFLFFVADGTGGHVFSETLAGHNKNVTAWRKIKKDKIKQEGQKQK